jgi:putative ABC transport system permease protein
VQSVDLGRPIPDRWQDRIESHPDVERVEPYVITFAPWTRITSQSTPATPENCTLIGSKLEPQSLGAVEFLRSRPDLLTALQEPMTCVVDEGELGRLGIPGPGVAVDIFGHKVRVVGLVSGYRSIGGPYVFCSLQTARTIANYRPGEVTYLLAKCRTPEGARALKAKLAQREYATMRAMGIPRWRLKMAVLGQSFWVGLLGIVVAVPFTLLLAGWANRLGTRVVMHPAVVATAIGITMLMAIGSGLAALRSFQGVDPAHNIR